jgi:NAD(P)-dependent dehydrogenase (short-subunit alcohol dehydrogenase family)
MMRTIIPGMVEHGWGRIVNIATGADKFPVAVRILSGSPRAALFHHYFMRDNTLTRMLPQRRQGV